ncbi:unnamed protein product [Larinioides sclopetarius]|uniref:Uncharacterized protein n=1 Tax=Larinioides sclopetarius TaxID=280406 RepID=A0AAV2A0C2_9ARAC
MAQVISPADPSIFGRLNAPLSERGHSSNWKYSTIPVNPTNRREEAVLDSDVIG